MKLKTYSRVLAVILTCLWTLGCTSSSSESEKACSQFDSRILNGQQCETKGSPVVLILLYNSKQQIFGACTGTMVTQRDVLTAAHCVRDAADFQVQIDGINFLVSNAATHPRYNGNPNSVAFDVAMMTLSRSANLQPLPLVLSRDLNPGEKIGIFGYGVDEQQNFTGDLRGAFMKVSELDGSAIVASFDSTETSVCFGDSGGPATIKNNDDEVGLVGVASAVTKTSCAEGSFAVFVDLQNQDVASFILNYSPAVGTI